jgi:ATP-dependent DNA helicase RecG
MADLMRRFGICEEKSSGIDRVVETVEILQLPVPDFLVSYKRTIDVIYGPRKFRDMEGSDRIRACYQHCVLQLVLRRQMASQSLRKRFGVSEGSSNTISQIIAAAAERAGIGQNRSQWAGSKRYTRYVPAWAYRLLQYKTVFCYVGM